MRQIAPVMITHLHAGLPHDKNIYRTSVHMAAHYKTKTSTPFIKIKQLGRLLRPLGGRMPSRPACPLNPRSPGSTTIRIKPKIYAIFDIIVFHLVSVNKNKNLENFLVTHIKSVLKIVLKMC